MIGNLIAAVFWTGFAWSVWWVRREARADAQRADEWAALRRHERRQRALARIGDEVRQ